MSRRLYAVAAALLAVGAGLLVPAPARATTVPQAAQPALAPSVTIGPDSGDEMTIWRGTGTGFAPDSDVTVAVTVDGRAYTYPYTKVRHTDASGSFSWSWIWTSPDPFGQYEFEFSSDAGGAMKALDIEHAPTAPSAAADTHLMLDTRSAPPLATVQAWQRNSPYAAIGVYLPTDPAVDNRSDKRQANLTAGWVDAVEGGGWHVVPIHVGLQAPSGCDPTASNLRAMSADPTLAEAQGAAAATSAVAAANALGIASSAPIVSDMESYAATGCAPVRSYLRGWIAELHRLGRLAAVYGSPSHVAADLAAAHAADPAYPLPDLLWAATDNRQASLAVSGLPNLGADLANQYLFNVARTYAGATLSIDESAVADAVWTAVAPTTRDRVAPSVRLVHAARVVRRARTTFRWTGADTGSGLARYELRTARTVRGHGAGAWSRAAVLAPARSGHVTLGLRPGERVCVQVRAVDAAENVSGWSRAACTSRPAPRRHHHPHHHPRRGHPRHGTKAVS